MFHKTGIQQHVDRVSVEAGDGNTVKVILAFSLGRRRNTRDSVSPSAIASSLLSTLFSPCTLAFSVTLSI